MKELNIWKFIIIVVLGWKILEFIILYEENRVFKKVKIKKINRNLCLINLFYVKMFILVY